MTSSEIIDLAFGAFVMGNAPLEKLATGFDWVEGPVWFGDAGCLLFSDIPNNRILRWTPGGGISTCRDPSNFSNGHAHDREGRLLSCKHRLRRVTRTEHDGRITVIACGYQGKPFNSPNDVVVKSASSTWLSEPHYGNSTDYEGHKSAKELPYTVYRVDPSGAVSVVADDFHCPNGLAILNAETRLYIADTGRMFYADPQHIRAFDVVDNQLTGGGVFHTISPGCADGIRTDTDGNLWSLAADGVHCIAPDGHLMGKILVPEAVLNICFGGRGKHQLFIAATANLYSIALNRNGAQTP